MQVTRIHARPMAPLLILQHILATPSTTSDILSSMSSHRSHKDQQSKDPAHPFSERKAAGATALSGEDDSTSQQSKDKQDEATASAKETVQLAKDITAEHSSSGGQKA